jgi:hypothetical protein
MARSSNDTSAAHLDFGDVATLDGATTAFLSIWIKMDSWAVAYQGIFSKDPWPVLDGGWILQRGGTDSLFQWSVRGPGGVDHYSLGGPTFGSWTHVAVYQTATHARFYIGGTLDRELTPTASGWSIDIAATMRVWVENSSVDVAEAAIWRDPGFTSGQALDLAAALAAGGNPRNQATPPTFYAPLNTGSIGSTGGTEADVIGGSIAATAPANSVVVAHPTIDAYGSASVAPPFPRGRPWPIRYPWRGGY